jgi:hypothetical protein
MNNRIVSVISAALALSAATALFAPAAPAQPQTKQLLNMKTQAQGKMPVAQPKRATKLPTATNRPSIEKQVKRPPYTH